MASRLALPKVPRIAVDLDLREWVESGRRGLAWRPPRGVALRRALWRGATVPYWFASDVPAPHLPAWDKKAPSAGLAGDQVVRQVQEIGRRVWLQRALTIVARSAWLGIFIGCLWLLLELQGGPKLDVRMLIWIAGAIAIPGLVFAALVRPTRRQVALMLDRSFGLQERVTTAIENLGKDVPADGERARLVYLQVADAANVVGDLRRFPVFSPRLPIRELVMAVVCALLFASLFFMRGVGGGIPPVQAGAVPPFTPASERMAKQPTTAAPTGAQANAPTVADVQKRADRSNQARQDLDALAKALQDHAVTNSAADAMNRGDYPTAANDLRNLAQDAGKLSPASREALAQSLDQAASQMSQGSKQLADATQQAADGLRQGNQAAQDGMRNLGDAVQKTGSEVASQQELAQQMQQAQQAQAANQSKSGNPSQSNSGAQAADQSSSQNGQQQTDSQSPAGQQSQSDPGANAQPGSANQSANSNQSQNSAQPGAAQNGGQQQPGQNGQTGQPGAAQQPGQTANGQPGKSAQPGQQSQQDGQPGQNAQSGAGASSGSSQNGTGATQAQNPSQSQQAANGTSPDPKVANGNGNGGKGDGKGATTDPHEAITLSRAPNGQNIQTSNNNGGSNTGSGPGASVSQGTSTQDPGVAGASGPDSNRVPADYRSIVENYFSDQEGSP
jgi:hypothetical protein